VDVLDVHTLDNGYRKIGAQPASDTMESIVQEQTIEQ